jgi:hypothetical protein
MSAPTVITIGTQSIVLVPDMPATPGLQEIQWSFEDSVGVTRSEFTGQDRTQRWPGADAWSGVATWAPLTQAQADARISWLLGLRGMAYGFLLGDPLKTAPAGSVAGSPHVDNTQNAGNQAMSQQLGTAGWTASAAGVLLAGDYIQVGYRLHRVVYDVAADSSGKAVVTIWPSLREQPADSSSIITTNPRGLMRRAQNKDSWSADFTRTTRLSFPFQEYR